MLETLIRVDATGSFTEAANDLGMSQSSVTKLVKELETLLGVELIHRTTRRMATTAAGAKVVEDAIELVDGWDRLVETHGNGGTASRTVRVFAPIGLGQDHLFDLVMEFQAQHDALRVEWFLENGSIPFHSKGADLWICQGPVREDSLVVRPVGHMRTVLVASPTEQIRSAIGNLDEIEKLEAVSIHPSDRDGLSITLSDGRPHRLNSPVRLLTNNFPSVCRAVRAGLGYAAMPLWSVSDDLAEGRLIELLPDAAPEPIQISLVYSPRRFHSPILTAFIKYLQREILEIEGIS